MNPEVSENDLLIEDIDPELLRQIEERARAEGRSVEEEALFLLKRALLLSER
jgi:plasmid stability protein